MFSESKQCPSSLLLLAVISPKMGLIVPFEGSTQNVNIITSHKGCSPFTHRRVYFWSFTLLFDKQCFYLICAITFIRFGLLHTKTVRMIMTNDHMIFESHYWYCFTTPSGHCLIIAVLLRY